MRVGRILFALVVVATCAATPDASGATATPTVPFCTDGSDGKRVEVVYAYKQGTTPALTAQRQQITNWVALIDWAFDKSASLKGASAHPRWAFSPGCELFIRAVAVPGSATSDFFALKQAMRDQLLLANAQRKYVVFIDGSDNGNCKLVASHKGDDSGNYKKNRNNGIAGQEAEVAMISRQCWKFHDFTERPLSQYGVTWLDWGKQHEVMHTLGAVNTSAPHYAGGGHCSDDYDAMCFSRQQDPKRCSDFKNKNLFDCKQDDYFAVSPQCDSYIAQKWNTYNSSFLVRNGPKPQTCAIKGPSSTSDRTPTFKFVSNRPGSRFECAIDSGAFSACGNSFTTPKLSIGSHKIKARAIDQDGLVDGTPREKSFTIT